MTEQAKAPKVVDPKLQGLFDNLNTVKAAGKKLLTINERAAAADSEAAKHSAQLVAVLQGTTTEGEQDVSVLTNLRKKALAQGTKIRGSAGEYARDLLVARDSLNAMVAELTNGIEPAAASEGEPKLTDDDGDSNEQEEEEEEIDA